MKRKLRAATNDLFVQEGAIKSKYTKRILLNTTMAHQNGVSAIVSLQHEK